MLEKMSIFVAIILHACEVVGSKCSMWLSETFNE